MQYYEIQFQVTPYSEAACDLLSAIVAECAGLESFIPTPHGINGYVQTNLFDRTGHWKMPLQIFQCRTSR